MTSRALWTVTRQSEISASVGGYHSEHEARLASQIGSPEGWERLILGDTLTLADGVKVSMMLTLDGQPIDLDNTIEHIPDYVGHWIGEAYFTYHRYGVQVHQTRGDAERWNYRQRQLNQGK